MHTPGFARHHRLLLAVALTACASDPEENGGGGGGKADDPGAVCTFDQPSPLGDTTEDLAEFAVGNIRVSAADIDSLSALESAQLVAAVVQLGMAEPGVELAAVFELSDDGEFDIIDIERESDDGFLAADWVSFFAGDNEVGVVFADGSTTPIAEVSDGDLMHCEAPDAAPVCSFDQPSPLGDTTEDLAEFAVGNIRVSAADIDSLSALESAQLVAAVVQLGMAEPGVELAAVFELSDDGEFDIIDIERESDGGFLAADWVSFFAGDNEVGVVFADGTTIPIAQVSDGDLMHCE